MKINNQYIHIAEQTRRNPPWLLAEGIIHLNSKLDIKTIGEVLADITEPPPPIVEDGILLEKTLLLIYGKQKSRKTFLAFNLAIAIAHGQNFAIFRTPSPRRVLLLSAEGGYYPMRTRLRKMYESAGLKPNDNLSCCFNAQVILNDDDNFEALNAQIARVRPEVMILDPFCKFHNQDENSSAKMTEVMRRLRSIIDKYGLSVILVHHAGKSEEAGPRGSSSILGEYDSCIEISNAGDSTHRLSFEMRHVETPEPVGIGFNVDTLWFEEEKIYSIPLEVKAAISKLAEDERTKSALVKLLRDQEVPSSTAYRYAEVAVEAQLVTDGKKVIAMKN